jgi:hypothetical protein
LTASPAFVAAVYKVSRMSDEDASVYLHALRESLDLSAQQVFEAYLLGDRLQVPVTVERLTFADMDGTWKTQPKPDLKG